ncbi:hypothetical protein N5C55_01435 [Pseudomonas otitidis]|uniref:hypothetical protein n=1 Tax=Pseudomonadaceae TaxID=135621 RepID=UPI00244B7D5C|nr:MULTISPECIES: hypothetical protein [Pseudomonas]MDH1110002.1 hypothetical protein [Pseudomonas otitidis]MDH1156827.1 hypothetical protein [Pseudomonas otitidis]MDH1163300.1 hypothetical protein [Pseudomonas otitidis]MDU9398397.1 hypothetical protein [Pseudomonas sp. zfem003]
MTMETRLIALAQAIGADVKSLRAAQGDLTSLSTTAKGNLVAAINEVVALVGAGGVQIDDGAGNGDTGVTWSADKIFDSIEQAKQAVKDSILGGAGAALDTLKELADALNNDPNFAATIATQISNRVRYDAAQTLTTAQRLQVCQNIGIGDPESDFVAAYNTAKA